MWNMLRNEDCIPLLLLKARFPGVGMHEYSADEPVVQSEQTVHMRLTVLIHPLQIEIGRLFRARVLRDCQPTARMEKWIRERLQPLLDSVDQGLQFSGKCRQSFVHPSRVRMVAAVLPEERKGTELRTNLSRARHLGSDRGEQPDEAGQLACSFRGQNMLARLRQPEGQGHTLTQRSHERIELGEPIRYGRGRILERGLDGERSQNGNSEGSAARVESP